MGKVVRMSGSVAWLRRGGVFLAVALVLAAAAAVLVAFRGFDADERSASNRYDATRLSFDVDSADVQVRSGSGDRIRIERVVRGEAEISERVDGDTLHVEARCPWPSFSGCRVEYEAVVPRDVAVRVKVDSGDVRAAGITGALEVAADSGEVRVSGVSGQVELTSDSGDVTASGLSGKRVRAASDSGDVRLEFTEAPETVHASADSGDAEVRVPSGAAYAVDAETSSGDRDVRVPPDGGSPRKVAVSSDSGDVRVRSG